jgi:hypothetical protein
MKIEVWDRGFKANEGLRNYVGLRPSMRPAAGL